ncbi:hypothetical protein BGW36DRAFT_110858 [Talaromyces proteolyticus]|uniref:Secreted protein n=1 Tax=Talaromyces proteolyticus TaxID=1131652 RepID=A0AAD4Q3W6_9EURO|nr:uncharacterized protein BGW36DRAFT_110858 [Talaromyces proteolyticus]KAH8702082.1 hypothetical protein BGW36DRAFT_110858 [Talaromyces proteolyticus]
MGYCLAVLFTVYAFRPCLVWQQRKRKNLLLWNSTLGLKVTVVPGGSTVPLAHESAATYESLDRMTSTTIQIPPSPCRARLLVRDLQYHSPTTRTRGGQE